MARLFKQKYPQTQSVTGPDGKKRREPVRDRHDKLVYRESKKWYIEFRDASDQLRRVPGFTDKAATEQRAAELERETAREQSGLIDRFAAHRRRALVEHLADWRTSLSADNTPEYASQKHARALRVIQGCRFRLWPEISASNVQVFIAELSKGPKGLSIQTRNQYLDAVKAFAKWMVQDGRAPESPVAHLKGGNPKKDRRRVRRAYTVDELRRLIAAASAGDELYGLPGWVRGLLYRLVVEAGLRQNELRTLTVRAVNAEGDMPSVTVRTAYCKVGREDELPLLPSAARDLQRRLESLGAGAPVFPLPSDRKQVIRMLRKDLDAAGIPYQDEDGHYADFHALRHTFITNLAMGGTAPKVTMDLARHTDVNLTMQRYAHTLLEDRAKAIQVLPDLSADQGPAALRATGTEDAESINSVENGMSLPECLPKSLAEGVNPVASVGSASHSAAGQRDRGKALKNRDFAAVGSAPDAVDMTADGGTRTHNLSFTKAVLYR